MMVVLRIGVGDRGLVGGGVFLSGYPRDSSPGPETMQHNWLDRAPDLPVTEMPVTEILRFLGEAVPLRAARHSSSAR